MSAGPEPDARTDQVVAVRGAELAVSSLGSGPRHLVWTHGLTSARGQEDEMGLFPWDLSPLARVVRYDVRGHGRSSPARGDHECTWEELAADLLVLVDRLEIERFVAAGTSLGAALALHAALAVPDRVEGLVLVLPPAAWEQRAAQSDVYRKMADLIEREGLEGFAERARGNAIYPFLDDEVPELSEILVERIRTWDADSVVHALRGAAVSDLPPREELARLEVPALVLTWPGDPGHPDASAVELARALPSATLEIADDVARVRGWRDDVTRFLSGLS